MYLNNVFYNNVNLMKIRYLNVLFLFEENKEYFLNSIIFRIMTIFYGNSTILSLKFLLLKTYYSIEREANEKSF